MYIICFIDDETKNPVWESASGEDAMHIRVDELVKSGVPLSDISVFDQKYEFDKTAWDEITEDDSIKKILEILDDSLARAGYKIMDSDRESLIIRDSQKDKDFEIKIFDCF